MYMYMYLYMYMYMYVNMYMYKKYIYKYTRERQAGKRFTQMHWNAYITPLFCCREAIIRSKLLTATQIRKQILTACKTGHCL